MLNKSVNNVLGEGMLFLDKCSKLDFYFLDFPLLVWSYPNSWFLKSGVSFYINFAPFLMTYLEHKYKAKLKGAHIRESKRVSKGWGDFTPNREEGAPH